MIKSKLKEYTDSFLAIQKKAESIGYEVKLAKKLGCYAVLDDEGKFIAKSTDLNHAEQIIEFALKVRNKGLKRMQGKLKVSKNGLTIHLEENWGINFATANTPENAKRIVKCVNMHDGLVKSLQSVVRLLEIYSNSTEPSLKGEGVDADIFKEAKAILVKAVK